VNVNIRFAHGITKVVFQAIANKCGVGVRLHLLMNAHFVRADRLAADAWFPGIVLYLTYWYPPARRGRMNALFMIGIPVAGVLGGPLSGWIMQAFNGVQGATALVHVRYKHLLQHESLILQRLEFPVE
jgi:MFS family permease